VSLIAQCAFRRKSERKKGKGVYSTDFEDGKRIQRASGNLEKENIFFPKSSKKNRTLLVWRRLLNFLIVV
jgi:stalled ribosome alternative rescue factor ArfA